MDTPHTCRESGLGGARVGPVTGRLPGVHSRLPPLHLPGDAAARELARTAQTVAEVISTEHNGTYKDVSLTTLHTLEPSIPISPRQAHRKHEGAYLLSASGTENSYLVTTYSQNGDTYTIRRASSGSITRSGHVCGKRRSW